MELKIKDKFKKAKVNHKGMLVDLAVATQRELRALRDAGCELVFEEPLVEAAPKAADEPIVEEKIYELPVEAPKKKKKK